VAAAFGLLSVIGPFTFLEATLGTQLAFTAMHVLLTAAIVGGPSVLTKRARGGARLLIEHFSMDDTNLRRWG
jgi:hypothetical protein